MDNYDAVASTVGANLKIMDLQVDIEVQMEYMQMMRRAGKPLASDEAIANAQEQLLDPDTALSVKKKLLQKLSQVEKVEMLRFLEQYAADAADDLRDFAQLAAFHSQLYLESSLLDEPQMVVASGMGGKGQCLRFFVALFPETARRLSESQKRLVKKEFAYIFQDFNAEIENDIDFVGKYPKFTMLVPFQTHPSKIVAESIKSCNELGRFLRDGAIISNLKPLDDKEIDKVWHDIKQHEGSAVSKDNDDED
jgi:hypothetical protein